MVKEIGVTYLINLYSGTTHGFAVHANLDEEL